MKTKVTMNGKTIKKGEIGEYQLDWLKLVSGLSDKMELKETSDGCELIINE